jgi:site-specific recombinase XerC
MDNMAAEDLALSTMRVRQSTGSSFCAWLVKREVLSANPVTKLERPPHHREPPRQVPGSSIMDAFVEAAKQRRQPRDVAIFLILRYTGMRRESVATLRVHHPDSTWGLRGVRVKGGKKRDIPLPAAVMQFMNVYVEHFLVRHVERIEPERPRPPRAVSSCDVGSRNSLKPSTFGMPVTHFGLPRVPAPVRHARHAGSQP